MEPDLIERLERNARFYHNEAVALAEKPERRDNRYLGSREAQTIADLLNEAASALQAQETGIVQATDQA